MEQTMNGLVFSVNELNLMLAPGQVVDGYIEVRQPLGQAFEGVVRASGVGMECSEARIGSRTGMFPWRFDAAGFEDGDVVDGSFRLITDHGEYSIPYHVLVSAPVSESMSEQIMDKDGFPAMAEDDWDAALAFYYSRAFTDILRTDADRALYAGLSRDRGSSRNMESFLVQACGKAPVTFETEISGIETEIFGPGYQARVRHPAYEIGILRSGWGYTKITAETDCDYLTLVPASLTAEDFEGNAASIRVRIDDTRLHAGWNYARIILRSPEQTRIIPVRIRYRRRSDHAVRRNRARDRAVAGLLRCYEETAAGRTDREVCFAKARHLISSLRSAEPGSILADLYQIHLQLAMDRSRAAAEGLDLLRKRLAGVPASEVMEMNYQQYKYEDDELYCYRQYLTALCYKDGHIITPRVARLVRERLRRNEGNWRIAWMYMELAPEYSGHSGARWEFMRRQYERGSRGSVMYLEAWEMIAANPSLIFEKDSYRSPRKQNGTYLFQILHYAVRWGIMTPEVMEQVLYMVDTSRGFSPMLAGILIKAMDIPALSPMKEEILRRICSLLIREDITDPAYFSCFARAEEIPLKLPHLHEFYMNSMPADFTGEIPPRALSEITDQAILGYERKGFLYRYIYERKERLEGLYMRTKPKIRAFLEEQIAGGRITDNVVFLCRASLEDPEIRPSTEGLVPALFTCLVRPALPDAESLTVIYDHFRKEETWPVRSGLCRLPLYGDEVRLFASDRRGSRAVVGRDQITEQLPEEIIENLPAGISTTDPRFVMLRAGIRGEEPRVTALSEDAASALASARDIHAAYRGKILFSVLALYEEQGRRYEMEKVLRAMDDSMLQGSSRSSFLHFCSVCRPEEALRLLKRCGTGAVAEETLWRICQSAAQAYPDRRDPILGEFCHEAFRSGSRSEKVLRYASRFFVGLSAELEEIRRAMDREGMDTRDLTERICEQIHFTGQIIDGEEALLVRYASDDRARPDTVRELLERYCGSLFIRETDPGDALCGLIEKIPDPAPVCRIVWLRKAAREEELTGSRRETAAAYIRGLLDQELIFPFYRHLTDLDSRIEAFARETLLSYHDPEAAGNDPRNIVVHYSLRENADRGTFASRRMKQMYPGYYVASFLLFCGEKINYFITDDPREEHVTEQGTLGQGSQPETVSVDRFGLIDRMSRSLQQGDCAAAIDHLRRCYMTDYMIRELFDR